MNTDRPKEIRQLQTVCLKMGKDVNMPMLGLGTLNMADDELNRAIRYAVSIGYRLFDCAWVYGNEAQIGIALEQALAESNGRVKREDLFIVSKVWNTHHSKEMVRKSFDESCKNLRVKYLDLFLIHWPTGFKEDAGTPFPVDSSGNVIDSGVHYLETYQALESLHQEGLVRSIGVSNFNIEQLRDVLDNCKIKPSVNQFEINPYYQNNKLVEFCHKNDVNVQAYAPFGVGMKHPEMPELHLLVAHPTLMKIGSKYNKTAAQVCIRWLLQRNISTFPKSRIPERILQNAQIFDFSLTSDDMNEIKLLNLNIKSDVYKSYVNTEKGKFNLTGHRFYPFKDPLT